MLKMIKYVAVCRDAAVIAATLVMALPAAYAQSSYTMQDGGKETLSVDNTNRIFVYDTYPLPKNADKLRWLMHNGHEQTVAMVRRVLISQVCEIGKSRHAILTWNYTAVNRIWHTDRSLIVEVFATRDDCLRHGG